MINIFIPSENCLDDQNNEQLLEQLLADRILFNLNTYIDMAEQFDPMIQYFEDRFPKSPYLEHILEVRSEK